MDTHHPDAAPTAICRVADPFVISEKYLSNFGRPSFPTFGATRFSNILLFVYLGLLVSVVMQEVLALKKCDFNKLVNCCQKSRIQFLTRRNSIAHAVSQTVLTSFRAVPSAFVGLANIHPYLLNECPHLVLKIYLLKYLTIYFSNEF